MSPELTSKPVRSTLPAGQGTALVPAGGDVEQIRETIATPSSSSLAFKRGADVILASLGLLALAPLLALTAVAVKLDSPGPVLYCNERIGRGGRRFRLYKFRTMYRHACRGERYGAAEAEELFRELMCDPARREEFERIHKLRRDPRVTRLGAILRRTSLDELPQLVNVILGQLSIVGPRPVMAYEVTKLKLLARSAGERHGDAQHGDKIEQRSDGAERGHDLSMHVCPPGYWETPWLRPGITGYWQVTARSEVGYEERLHMDLLYTTNWSLRFDLRIVLRTLGVLAGRGAY